MLKIKTTRYKKTNNKSKKKSTKKSKKEIN